MYGKDTKILRHIIIDMTLGLMKNNNDAQFYMLNGASSQTLRNQIRG